MNREFLQLAHNYDAKYPIGGWFVSEKLDGMRCYWDGGITRGLYCDQVPWANVTKDARLLSRPVSTGLWSRYGKPIMAPDWWIGRLPDFPLDGELYCGRGKFQTLISAAKKLNPNDLDWAGIQFMVFEAPHYRLVFQDGRINNTNFKKDFVGFSELYSATAHLPTDFHSNYKKLRILLADHDPAVVTLHEQTVLPWRTTEAETKIEEMLIEITDFGGEGLMLRNPSSVWTPKRVHHLLKVKRLESDTGIVVGWTPGIGKLDGLMGSLTIKWNGKVFQLSGFTDQERTLIRYGEQTIPKFFPVGTEVGFYYRELSDDGIPKEARYKR